MKPALLLLMAMMTGMAQTPIQTCETQPNNGCASQEKPPAQPTVWPKIAGHAQGVITPEQQAAFPSNAWVKPCGPHNHDDWCVQEKIPSAPEWKDATLLDPQAIRALALHQKDGPRCDKLNWPRTDIYCRALEEVAGQYFLLQAKQTATPEPEPTMGFAQSGKQEKPPVYELPNESNIVKACDREGDKDCMAVLSVTKDRYGCNAWSGFAWNASTMRCEVVSGVQNTTHELVKCDAAKNLNTDGSQTIICWYKPEPTK